MKPGIAVGLGLMFLSLVLLIGVWVMTYRLAPDARRKGDMLWLLGWTIKGVVLPGILWLLMNIGLSWWFQPFIPNVQAAQIAGRNWLISYTRFSGYGLFVISTYWAAVTLAWVLVRAGQRLTPAAARDLKGLCYTCGLGLAVPALLTLFLGGLPTMGLAASFLLIPIVACAPSIVKPGKLPPMYARAVARIKFGKYAEAEWEIIRELEKCEDDFQGWLMLAELYATNFNDLREAEQTILEICDQPRVTPSQLSLALQRLADWHLKIGGDPDAAKRALEVICTRLPGTHLARMAQLRINQLPVTASDLREQQNAPPIPLPALGDTLDQQEPVTRMQRNEAAAAANNCVERLQRDPNNVSAREKLARIFTEHLEDPEKGLEQITLLLNMPDQPDHKRAHWLSLEAAWQLRYLQDLETGRKLLRRIVEEFPNTPEALAAGRRLSQLDPPRPPPIPTN